MKDKDGYFDLQVNGYGGVDFNNDALTGEGLHKACSALQSDGVTGILATIMTDEIGLMCNRLRNLSRLREKDSPAKQIIAGIHIEGPFINEAVGYRGAHPADAIKPANVDDMQRLLDAAAGLTRIVTLAPERDEGLAVTKMLREQDVVVSAGHCNATLDELAIAARAGLSMFTHLGNGCPTEMDRHDNIIQRALSLSDKLCFTLIADGIHLPYFVLNNILRLAGFDRCVIVSDAMAAAGLGPGRYTLGRWDVLIGDDLAVRSPDGSHLIGSALSMRQSEANLRNELGLHDEQIRKLMMENPRQAIGLDAS
ncbi:MAG: N-acetylglucosamine-6-phosphate deacetylase [Actinobacteria bacterium]|nr:N-acetylglucosamine-6-phosphate deacetylase [Actinomycetota bacterium]